MQRSVLLAIIFLVIVSLYFALTLRSEHGTPNHVREFLKHVDADPTGILQLANLIRSKRCEGFIGSRDKADEFIEAFEEMQNVRNGYLGSSDTSGKTLNKWIKLAEFTLNGKGAERGFTLELYPKSKTSGSSRQTVIVLARNGDGDLDTPYISLATVGETNETQYFRDVALVRSGGTGTANNMIQVFGQMGTNQFSRVYVAYYLYNFQANEFVATSPGPQMDSLPQGTKWTTDAFYTPGALRANRPSDLRYMVQNLNSGAKATAGIQIGNDKGMLNIALNSSAGGNQATMRNTMGDMRVQGKNGTGLTVQSSGNVLFDNEIVGGVLRGNPAKQNGRVHIAGDDNLYLLNKKGVIVGREWGGNGNLDVQGNLTVRGMVNMTSESKIAGDGKYQDPEPKVQRDLKLGSKGLAVRGGIRTDTIQSGTGRFGSITADDLTITNLAAFRNRLNIPTSVSPSSAPTIPKDLQLSTLTVSGAGRFGSITADDLTINNLAAFRSRLNIPNAVTGTTVPENLALRQLSISDRITGEIRMGVNAYQDPEPNVQRDLKIGDKGLAVRGGLRADNTNTTVLQIGRWRISDEGGTLVFRDTVSGGDKRYAFSPNQFRDV